jgi:hypothetical protein
MESEVCNVDDPSSFLSVFRNASRVSAKYSLKYKNEIIEYITEWESVMSTRVDKDAQDTKKLREMFNHYQDKVDTLRSKINSQETKGKDITAAMSEKFQRNEEKLNEACELYEASARPLCILIEEVVQCGYKDLYPLIVMTMKFEMEHSQSASRALHGFQYETFENEFHKLVNGASAASSISTPGAPSFNGSKNKLHADKSKKAPIKSSGSLSTNNTSTSGKNNIVRAPKSLSHNKVNEPSFATDDNFDNGSESSSSTLDGNPVKVDAV